MEYLKTFLLLAFFIFLAVFNVRNVIIHTKENKPIREEKRRRKKEARMAKRAKRRGQPWPPVSAEAGTAEAAVSEPEETTEAEETEDDESSDDDSVVLS